MGKWLLFLILSTAITLPACHSGKDEPSTQEDVTQQAIDLMQSGKNDEAIQILEKENASRPAERTKILLSSAYASRAQIRVENYWGFVIGYEKLVGAKDLDGSTDDKDLSDILGQISPEVQKSVKRLNVNLASLQKLRRRLDQIPTITDTQQQDLLKAISVLKDTVSPGGRLYRAVLEIIILKSSTEKAAGFFQGSAEDFKSACTQKFKLATDWMKYTYSLMQNILQDLAVAYPSQKEAITKVQTQFVDLLGNVADSADKSRDVLCAKQ